MTPHYPYTLTHRFYTHHTHKHFLAGIPYSSPTRVYHFSMLHVHSPSCQPSTSHYKRHSIHFPNKSVPFFPPSWYTLVERGDVKGRCKCRREWVAEATRQDSLYEGVPISRGNGTLPHHQSPQNKTKNMANTSPTAPAIPVTHLQGSGAHHPPRNGKTAHN